MNDDATINSLGGKYAGMDRYEARKAMGQGAGTVSYTHLRAHET